MQEGYVKVNDVNLHYVEEGEGELMLFLHGFPYFWYNWHHQIDRILEGLSCCRGGYERV